MIIFLIFLSVWFGLSLNSSYVIFGSLSILLFIYSYKRIGKRFLPLIGFVFSLSYAISFININIDRKTYEGFVIESKENYFLFKSNFQKLYVYDKNHSYEIGDYLSIKGYKDDLSFTKIESSFDFQSYLNKKGVIHELNANKITVKFKNPIRIKERREAFLSHFNEETRNVISSILFSESENEGIVSHINSLHIIKFVSSSGFYLYLFIKFIELFLTIKLKKKTARLISLSLLIPYAIFTFPRFTVLRFYAFAIFTWINEHKLNRKYDKLSIIGFIGLSFIMIDFHYAYSDSFILGFSFPIFSYYSNKLFIDKKKIKRTVYKTLLNTAFFFPFELKFYNSFAPLSNVYGILFTPIFSLIGIMSLIAFFGLPIYKPIESVINISKEPVKWLSSLSLELYASKFIDSLVVIYYVILFAFIYYKYIGLKPLSKLLVAMILTMCSIKLIPMKNFIIEKVSFINVGQGDSCLIQKGTTSILIDTGGLTYTDIADNCLIPYFKKNHIYDIDCLITTHDDFDHNGGVDSLINNFKVKSYINTSDNFPLSINGINIENLNNYIEYDDDNNASSLVLKFKALNKDFLIMGDAPIEVEKKIIKEYPTLKCNVLKVGHHGSKTSTCKEFIRLVSPEDAIISVGKNNKYGHPNKEVIEILTKYNVNILRTDIEGTIIYKNYIFM